MMDHNDHVVGVGAIVTNLQALETSLRFFLGRRYDQYLEFPKPGDLSGRKNYLTAFSGKQGHLHLYTPGISAESVGARRIHLQIVRFPPDGRANAHKHDGHETAIYVLSGESGMWYGERLEQHLIARAGEFLYIPANMPHLPYNLSARLNVTPGPEIPR